EGKNNNFLESQRMFKRKNAMKKKTIVAGSQALCGLGVKADFSSGFPRFSEGSTISHKMTAAPPRGHYFDRRGSRLNGLELLRVKPRYSSPSLEISSTYASYALWACRV